MANVYDPISSTDLSQTDANATGVFTQPVASQAPVFPTQAGAYPIGGNPLLQNALMAQKANEAQHTQTLGQGQLNTIQSANTASQLANQIAVEKIKQQMQGAQQDQLAQIMRNNGDMNAYGSNGGLIPSNISDPLADHSPQAYALNQAVNTSNIAGLQNQITLSGLQSQQQALPIQQQIMQAGNQALLGQQNQQFINNASYISNFQKYNPDFRTLPPLDITQAPDQQANTQLQRASQVGGLDQLPNVQQALNAGQPLKPLDVIQDPGFSAMRQRDPQQASNLFYGLFGTTPDSLIARLKSQHEEAQKSNADAARKGFQEGNLRFDSTGLLQKQQAGVGGVPSGTWNDEGSPQFPAEEAGLFHQGIASGATGVPMPTITNSPREMIINLIRQGMSLPQATQAMLAWQAGKAKSGQAAPASTMQFSPNGLPLRPLTPIQQASQPNPLMRGVNWVSGFAQP